MTLRESAEWGNPVIESLEHFYGLRAESIAEKLRSDLGSALDRGLGLLETADLLRCAEFTQLHLRQQRSRPLDRVGGADLEEGHLRAAFIGRELVDVPKGGRPTVFLDGKHLGQDRLPSALTVTRGEVKAALCYAHDIVVEDPFDEEQDLGELVRQFREIDPETTAMVTPDPQLFVANVAAVAELAPLVREGVVRFSPRTLAMNPRLAGVGASNAWDVDQSAEAAEKELVDRMMRVWLHSGGTIIPVFDGEAQEHRFSDTLGLLAHSVDTTEVARLRKLGTLALPAADRLDLRHMLDVREESVFRTFRARQRAVLAAVGDGDPGDAGARALFREEMKAAADELSITTSRSRFAKAMSPRMIGWGVGGFVGASFDWRAAAAVLAAAAAGKIADFLSGSVAEALADAPPRGTRALHHHYATLAERPEN